MAHHPNVAAGSQKYLPLISVSICLLCDGLIWHSRTLILAVNMVMAVDNAASVA